MRRGLLQELDKELKQEGLRDPSVPAPQPAKKRSKAARPAPAATIGKIDLEAFAQSIAEKTGIDYEKLGASIGLAIVQGMKAAAVDPEKERIKIMRRQQMRETQQESMDSQIDRWLSCSHMRTHPYSGTARIGWATQSDGLTRGTCMGCGCPFTPVEAELPISSDKEKTRQLRSLYEKMRALPVSIAHNDFLSGMVVAGNPA
jgi:hypothetical protein